MNLSLRASDAVDGELIASYTHPPAHKIGVLVRARGASEEAARRNVHEGLKKLRLEYQA